MTFSDSESGAAGAAGGASAPAAAPAAAPAPKPVARTPCRVPLTLCIVNHDGESVLEATIVDAVRAGSPFDEVLLVDNASTDRGLEIVERRFPTVKILRLPENRGPGAARNAGFAAASASRVLFVDNDVRLQVGCPAALVRALADRPEALLAMPRVLHAADPDTIQYEGADSHYLGLMALGHAERPIAECPPATRLCQSLVTACFLVAKDRWTGGDLFDESFFFNYEDHDLGVRSRIAGHEIVAVGEARALHGEGTAGLSHRPGRKASNRRVFCLIRNRWQILGKSYSARSLVLLLPMLLVYETFQLVGVVRKGWIGPWVRAVTWMATHVPAVLANRRAVQASRRLPDREILAGGALPFTGDLARTGFDRAGRELLDALSEGYWRLVRGAL